MQALYYLITYTSEIKTLKEILVHLKSYVGSTEKIADATIRTFSHLRLHGFHCRYVVIVKYCETPLIECAKEE